MENSEHLWLTGQINSKCHIKTLLNSAGLPSCIAGLFRCNQNRRDSEWRNSSKRNTKVQLKGQNIRLTSFSFYFIVNKSHDNKETIHFSILSNFPSSSWLSAPIPLILLKRVTCKGQTATLSSEKGSQWRNAFPVFLFKSIGGKNKSICMKVNVKMSLIALFMSSVNWFYALNY